MALHVASSVPAARAGLPRAPAVVVVVAPELDETARACLEAALTYTPADVPHLVMVGSRHEQRGRELEALKGRVGDRPVVVLEQPGGLRLDDAVAVVAPSDVVLLAGHVVVGPQWYRRLQEAAGSSNQVATASPLFDRGTFLSPWPDPAVHASAALGHDEAARRIAAGSPRLRPDVAMASPQCSWVRRAALDLLGGFGLFPAPVHEQVLDFSRRAVAAGLQHVCADDVYVRLPDGDEPADRARPAGGEELGPLPADTRSPLATALLAARTSVSGMSVAVDGMCLGADTSGTQVVVTETVRALSARPAVRAIEVFVPTSCPEPVRAALAASPVVTVTALRTLAPASAPSHDLVYRPYQLYNDEQLAWLTGLGRRLVVSQLDLIAFRNPTNFPSPAAWQRYRAVTRRVGATADGIAFLSEHVLRQALAESLAGPRTTTRVVSCGTDHVGALVGEATPPRAAPDLAPGFLLSLGASYGHKNRPFCLRVLQQLVADGWQGRLVLAGRTPPHGSTRPAEQELLRRHPELAAHVVELGPVDEAEKTWLYRHSGLVLYPTSAEGFGLVPFEAASHGVPCLSTRQGSLDEVLPAGLPALDGWDVAQAAHLARRLLEDEGAATALVQALDERARQYTWAAVAERLEELFLDVVRSPGGAAPAALAPPPGIGPRARRALVRVRRELRSRAWSR